MEKIITDYKQGTWPIQAKLFRMHKPRRSSFKIGKTNIAGWKYGSVSFIWTTTQWRFMHNSTNLHVKFEPPCVVHIIGNDCVSIHVQVAFFWIWSHTEISSINS